MGSWFIAALPPPPPPPPPIFTSYNLLPNQIPSGRDNDSLLRKYSNGRVVETDTIHLYAKRSGYTPTSYPGSLLFTSLSLAPWDMKRTDPGNKVGYSPFHNYIFLCHSQISNGIYMLYFMTNYVAVNDFT